MHFLSSAHRATVQYCLSPKAIRPSTLCGLCALLRARRERETLEGERERDAGGKEPRSRATVPSPSLLCVMSVCERVRRSQVVFHASQIADSHFNFTLAVLSLPPSSPLSARLRLRAGRTALRRALDGAAVRTRLTHIPRGCGDRHVLCREHHHPTPESESKMVPAMMAAMPKILAAETLSPRNVIPMNAS